MTAISIDAFKTRKREEILDMVKQLRKKYDRLSDTKTIPEPCPFCHHHHRGFV